MSCRNRCSHCIGHICLKKKKGTLLLSPSGPIRKHFFFFLPMKVTVSANLLVGRHRFVSQNTNSPLLSGCKEWPALLMQRRSQINAPREVLYNGSCCGAASAELLRSAHSQGQRGETLEKSGCFFFSSLTWRLFTRVVSRWWVKLYFCLRSLFLWFRRVWRSKCWLSGCLSWRCDVSTYTPDNTTIFLFIIF